MPTMGSARCNPPAEPYEPALPKLHTFPCVLASQKLVESKPVEDVTGPAGPDGVPAGPAGLATASDAHTRPLPTVAASATPSKSRAILAPLTVGRGAPRRPHRPRTNYTPIASPCPVPPATNARRRARGSHANIPTASRSDDGGGSANGQAT